MPKYKIEFNKDLKSFPFGEIEEIVKKTILHTNSDFKFYEDNRKYFAECENKPNVIRIFGISFIEVK